MTIPSLRKVGNSPQLYRNAAEVLGSSWIDCVNLRYMMLKATRQSSTRYLLEYRWQACLCTKLVLEVALKVLTAVSTEAVLSKHCIRL